MKLILLSVCFYLKNEMCIWSENEKCKVYSTIVHDSL